MSKQLMRNLLAAGCAGSGLLTLTEKRTTHRLHILCYHRVLPADRRARYPYPDLAVTPQSFRRHCQILSEHFQVLPLSEALTVWSQNLKTPRPLAAITFDDGYRDNFNQAAPILDQFNLKAAFLVITDLVGAPDPPWYDRLARALVAWHNRRGGDFSADHPIFPLIGPLPVGVSARRLVRLLVDRAKQLSPDRRTRLIDHVEKYSKINRSQSREDLIMDWPQLDRLARAGHEIGSHGASHDILTRLPDAELDRQIAGSRRILEERLNQPVGAFGYPNGDLDDRVARAVAAAGYRGAVTVAPGANSVGQDPFRLRRAFMHEERLLDLSGRPSPLLMRMELCGLSDYVLARKARKS